MHTHHASVHTQGSHTSSTLRLFNGTWPQSVPPTSSSSLAPFPRIGYGVSECPVRQSFVGFMCMQWDSAPINQSHPSSVGTLPPDRLRGVRVVCHRVGLCCHSAAQGRWQHPSACKSLRAHALRFRWASRPSAASTVFCASARCQSISAGPTFSEPRVTITRA